MRPARGGARPRRTSASRDSTPAICLAVQELPAGGSVLSYMRLVFLGTPEFALPIVEACATAGELAAVVAQPDCPVGRSGTPQAPATKTWALARGIPVEQPDKVKGGRLAQVLSRYEPEVAVVAAYGRILPPDALAVPWHGCLNV